MAGIFFIDGIKRSLRRRAREKKLAAAKGWPTVQGEVNHWQVLKADEDVATTGTPYQIEAGFHEPKVNVRFNPANPDETAVLAEDNSDNLPFKVVSG